MTAVFRWLGVDAVQWRAVTRTLLRTDFRLPLAERTSAISRVGGLLSMFFILSLFGLGAAIVVAVGRDVLLTGTFALAYLSVMLVTSLLTQHGMTMLSTTDFVILGSRPVSSRTFMAIRVTNVLFHALLITSLMGYPVILAFTFARGTNALRGAAAAAALCGWALLVAFTLTASYGAVLRAFGGPQLKRALGYMQLGAGFLIYGGLFVVSRVAGGETMVTTAAPDAWWLILIPPAWFASYIELAAGATNTTTHVRAVISVAALAAVVVALRGSMGLDYAGRLAELPHTGEGADAAATRTPFFTRGESRAAAILVLSHFKHDLRTRLGILAILPLIVLYLLIDGGTGSVHLVSLGVLLFPALLTRHFAASETPTASWIYYATPADHGRLVNAVMNVATVYFMLPFLALVMMIFAWRTGDAAHAVAHTAILGTLSIIALQGAILAKPLLPFAVPPDKTRGDASLLAWMVVVIIGGQAALAALDRWIYGYGVRTLALFVALLAVSVGLNAAVHRRLR